MTKKLKFTTKLLSTIALTLGFGALFSSNNSYAMNYGSATSICTSFGGDESKTLEFLRPQVQKKISNIEEKIKKNPNIVIFDRGGSFGLDDPIRYGMPSYKENTAHKIIKENPNKFLGTKMNDSVQDLQDRTVCEVDSLSNLYDTESPIIISTTGPDATSHFKKSNNVADVTLLDDIKQKEPGFYDNKDENGNKTFNYSGAVDHKILIITAVEAIKKINPDANIVVISFQTNGSGNHLGEGREIYCLNDKESIDFAKEYFDYVGKSYSDKIRNTGALKNGVCAMDGETTSKKMLKSFYESKVNKGVLDFIGFTDNIKNQDKFLDEDVLNRAAMNSAFFITKYFANSTEKNKLEYVNFDIKKVKDENDKSYILILCSLKDGKGNKKRILQIIDADNENNKLIMPIDFVEQNDGKVNGKNRAVLKPGDYYIGVYKDQIFEDKRIPGDVTSFKFSDDNNDIELNKVYKKPLERDVRTILNNLNNQ